MFATCKSLEILDNQDRDGNEVNYSDDDEDEDDDEENVNLWVYIPIFLLTFYKIHKFMRYKT